MLSARDRAEAEVASREGEVWRSVILRDLAASLKLEALGLEVALADVFAGVELADAAQGAGGA